MDKCLNISLLFKKLFPFSFDTGTNFTFSVIISS